MVLVWLGSVVSLTGTGAMFVALPFFTYTRTGSLVITAIVTLAEYAPAVGIAQLAGVLSDRCDPRRVLVLANLGLAACTLGYLVDQRWWWLAVVAFVRASISQIVTPASNTLIPALVPATAPPGRLAQVNGVLAMGSNLARLAGPAAGGTLVAIGGLTTVAVVDAASFAIAAILIAIVRPPEPISESGRTDGGLVVQWRAGWTILRQHPVLRPLLAVMMLVGFGEGFVSALMAPWMRDVAGGTSAQLGLMLSLQALGGIVGGLFVIRSARRRDSLSLLTAGAFTSGVMLVAIFNYPLLADVGPWPAIALTAVGGLPFAVYGTAESICVQTHSVQGSRGRIASLTYGGQKIAQLAGIAAAGPLALAVGPLAINAETGGYLTAAALAYTMLRRQRRSPTPLQPARHGTAG